MAIEIGDFPIKNGGSFHSDVAVYQRVSDDDPTSTMTRPRVDEGVLPHHVDRVRCVHGPAEHSSYFPGADEAPVRDPYRRKCPDASSRSRISEFQSHSHSFGILD